MKNMCYETASYHMSENLAMKSTVKSGVMTPSEPVSRTYTYRKGNYRQIDRNKSSSGGGKKLFFVANAEFFKK